jgi:HAD superfamily hydrolase (TIGR01458 family)
MGITQAYRAVLLDLSGVLYVGDTPVAGAVEAIARLRSRGLVLRLVTNTARKTRARLLADLADMGFGLESDTLYTAPLAAKAWVRARGLRAYCLVHPEVLPEFADLEQRDPNAVILGDAGADLNYANLNRAFRLCLDGAPLVVIGDNRYFRDESGLCLDAGPFAHALEYAADTRAVVMGKPARAFFEQVLAGDRVKAAQALMIGDDVSGDVEGALNAGLDACLVRSGKYQPGDEHRLGRTHYCFDSIVETVEWLLA